MKAREYAVLCALYEKHGIDASEPGFYDDPRFIDAESREAGFLESFGRMVECRPYEEVYLARSRKEIPAIARLVWEELVKDGRQGACVDVSMMLSRILEQEGFWNYIVKGSLTMTFPQSSGLTPRYFWSWDVVQQPFAAAHAWVVAPPFAVLDVSLKQQPFKKGQGQEFLPDLVVAEDVETSKPDPKDVFSPGFLAITRTSIDRAISRFAPRLHQFFKDFPPVTIVHDGMVLKYTRVAISAPDKPFPEMDGWPVNGRIGIDFYKEVVKPHLEQLRND